MAAMRIYVKNPSKIFFSGTSGPILTKLGMKHPLRKHAHAILREKIGCKNENFHRKIFDIFLIFAQNIDCGYTLEPRRGGSNEYPQSMFWNKNKKNRYIPVYPSFSV